MNTFQAWFEHLAIRGKLTLLASLSSGFALLLAGLVLAIADYRSDQKDLLHRVETQAQIAARDTAAAVAFDDADAARRSLAALSADTAFVAAAIRRMDHSVLALYGPDLTARPDGDLIHIQTEVVLDGPLGVLEVWLARDPRPPVETAVRWLWQVLLGPSAVER